MRGGSAILAGLAAAALLAGVPAAWAQYDLGWFTIDGGGGMFSTGGGYELGGTIGQPDAGGGPHRRRVHAPRRVSGRLRTAAPATAIATGASISAISTRSSPC